MKNSGFTRKKVHTFTLGEKLKKLRDDKRVSLRDVSKQTGIKKEYLEFLESGKYAKLPADVYAKGFLRSYADYLGVPSKALIRLFDREKGIEQHKESKANQKAYILKSHISSFVFTPKVVITFLVIAVVFGGFLYLYTEFDNFVSEPRLVILEPVSGSQVHSLSVPVRGTAEKDALVFINGQEVLVDEEGGFSQEIELHQGTNTLIVEAENIFSKRTKEDILVEAVFTKIDEEENSENETKENIRSVPVTIYTDNEPVWIQVSIDAEEVYSGIMGTEDALEYTAKEIVQISSGNGMHTHIIIDNKDLGALSYSPGVVENWEYRVDTQENVQVEDDEKVEY